MSDYLFNLAVISAYAISLLGGCTFLALAVVPEPDGRTFRGAAILGAFLIVNFFAMAASGVAVRS